MLFMGSKFDIVFFALLFCYVFAFFIGPISISLLIAVPLYFVAIFDKRFHKDLLFVLNSKLIKDVFRIWALIMLIGTIFPIISFTFDWSFIRIVGMQLFHITAAIPFFAFLKYRDYCQSKIESYFVAIFVLQTVIQIVVLNSPMLGEYILRFNHFDPEVISGIGSDIRGKALSAATTYHLSLVYGMCFIIYVKRFLSIRVSLFVVLIGLFVFVGIFFAGRTGFVGCLIGFASFLLKRQNGVRLFPSILKIVVIVLGIIVMINLLLMLYVPDLHQLITDKVLPYAFEFLDNIDKTGTMETGSTNRLQEQWSTDFELSEWFLGSGHFSNPDQTYYMHVDPGILRIPLFMGIFGYILVWLYQLNIFPVWKFSGTSKYYCYLIYLYLGIMDFKGVTIGLNKFTLSTTLLFSFIYLYLKPSENKT